MNAFSSILLLTLLLSFDSAGQTLVLIGGGLDFSDGVLAGFQIRKPIRAGRIRCRCADKLSGTVIELNADTFDALFVRLEGTVAIGV